MPTPAKHSVLIPPCGGTLVSVLVTGQERDDLIRKANDLPFIQLSPRSLCDLELLATGAFSPLDRFMGRDNHSRVLDTMRLSGGHVFPIPVTLPVEPSPAIRLDREVALRNAKNELLAMMMIE